MKPSRAKDKGELCCGGRRGRATSAAPLSALGVASTVAAILAPKCPLCIAAYLTLCGLGAGWAGAVAPVVRPAAFAVSFVAFATLVVVAMRRRRRRPASSAAANADLAGPRLMDVGLAFPEGAPMKPASEEEHPIVDVDTQQCSGARGPVPCDRLVDKALSSSKLAKSGYVTVVGATGASTPPHVAS